MAEKPASSPVQHNTAVKRHCTLSLIRRLRVLGGGGAEKPHENQGIPNTTRNTAGLTWP